VDEYGETPWWDLDAVLLRDGVPLAVGNEGAWTWNGEVWQSAIPVEEGTGAPVDAILAGGTVVAGQAGGGVLVENAGAWEQRSPDLENLVALDIDAAGVLRVLTDNRWLMRREGGGWVTESRLPYRPCCGPSVKGLARDDGGRLLAISDGDLLMSDDTGWEVHEIDDELEIVAPQADGTVLLAGDYLFAWRAGAITRLTDEAVDSSDWIVAACLDGDGVPWIATRDRLYRVEGGRLVVTHVWTVEMTRGLVWDETRGLLVTSAEGCLSLAPGGGVEVMTAWDYILGEWRPIYPGSMSPLAPGRWLAGDRRRAYDDDNRLLLLDENGDWYHVMGQDADLAGRIDVARRPLPAPDGSVYTLSSTMILRYDGPLTGSGAGP
jgi:hypothetical protein